MSEKILGLTGATTLYNDLRDRTTELNTNLTEIKNSIGDTKIHFTWEQGDISTTAGSDQSGANYIRTPSFYSSASGINIELTSGYRYRVFYYDSAKSFTGYKNWVYVSGVLDVSTSSFYRLVIAKSPASAVYPSDGTNLIAYVGDYTNDVVENRDRIVSLESDVAVSSLKSDASIYEYTRTYTSTSLLTDDAKTEGYFKTVSSSSASASWNYYTASVSEGDIIHVKGLSTGTAHLYYLLDSNSTLVSYYPKTNSGTTENLFEIPEGVSTIVINENTGTTTVGEKITAYKFIKTTDTDADGLVYAYTDGTDWQQGYFGSNGVISSSSLRITPLTSPMYLNAGESIIINPGTLQAGLAVYSYSNGTYTRQSVSTIAETTTVSYQEDTYISFDFGSNPAGATSVNDFDGFILVPTTWRTQITTNTNRISALETAAAGGDNVLYGKKLVACGDSITAATNPNGGNFDSYAKLVADRNSMDYEAAAVSGSTMSNVEGKNPFCVDRYQAVPSDFDYLTIWFGFNDGAYSTVGTIEDTVDTTFYGAYKKVLDYLIATYPTKKIGLVVPYMTDTDFQTAVRNISELYGVPCLDLPNGKECSLVWGSGTTTATARKNALTYDGTHPNQDGHAFISTMYEAFLRRL